MSQVSLEVMMAAVRKYASDHCNEGGWDMVDNCYEDSELAEEIAGCTTVEEAIARLAEVAAVYHDRRLDAYHAGGLDDNGRLPEEKQEVSHTHCNCIDLEDTCDFCSYQVWMYDLKESGPVCDDGGYRPRLPPWQSDRDTHCPRYDQWYHTYCFLSQEALDNDCPF